MKTEISDFCKEYSRALIPAGAALDAVIGRIEQDSQEDVLRLNLAGFNEVKHRLKSLIDKVEGQQAYLLIFGPLKSGKSTLMNAISGTYVSEVTSLPAYPCLVYVRHGEKSTIKLTRYNGRETDTDKKGMEVLIEDSHSNLADRKRRAEEQGREFDPGLDYPEAIRRIDIGLAAKELNESGIVLVDTPGLYSSMKFGYDLMTREFRNSAACAVFVVKTDNLFLEQVFQEFNDLLGLFSRVFLAVNIDSSKRDLRPDGSLQPSLESQHPQRIIDAFQSLTMSAALRKASQEGRLKIYPIDLLNAASRHLQTGSADEQDALPEEAEGEKQAETGDSQAKAGETFDISTQEEPPVQPPKSERPNDFGAFLEDLTEYLNSSDYLFDLMNDSFRQGDDLRDEMSRHCSDDSVVRFRDQQRRLQAEAEEVNQQLLAVNKLAQFDWEEAFEDTHADARREASRFAEEIREELQKSLLAEIDDWFETDDCLADLVGKTWQRRMEELQKQISEKTAALVRNTLDTSSGGARPSPKFIIALDRVRLSLHDVYRHSIQSFSASATPAGDCAIQLDAESIPVNRTFWDRILFRSQAKVRRRLLGTNNANALAPQKKRRRLLHEGKAALEKCAETHLKNILPRVPARSSKDFLQTYIQQFKKNFARLLQSRKAELDAIKQNLEARIQANERISKTFENLDAAISELENEMTLLRHKFLRSARLARGFVIKSPVGAFTLWTLPYCGGIRLTLERVLSTEKPEEPAQLLIEDNKVDAIPISSDENSDTTRKDAPESSYSKEEPAEKTEDVTDLPLNESPPADTPIPETSPSQESDPVAASPEPPAPTATEETPPASDESPGSQSASENAPVRVVPKKADA